MNKKGNFVWIIPLLGILLFLFYLFIYPGVLVWDTSCLKEIAIKECKDRGLEYSSLGMTFFNCLKEPRSMGKESFRFLKDELKGCKKTLFFGGD